MNFDATIDRNQFPTMKWSRDFLEEHFGNPEAIPMSVADMDLPAPAAVIEAIAKRAAHPIYGYENRPESYYAALQSWYWGRHDWPLEREQVEPSPTILNAIAILIDQHSEPGQGVILQPPVFFEFRMAVRGCSRKIVKNPLKFEGGVYQMDFEDLEAKAANPENRILILCNPHNPVGRVWSRADLERLAEICERNGVFVISDEIHGDFAFPPRRYTPYLAVSQSATRNAAACLSPAKTFNISGLVDALAVIPDEEHRKNFNAFGHRYQTNKVSVFGMAAAEAAYANGADWLDEVLLYLQGNLKYMEQFLAENAPAVSIVEPEGTFLAWLDFRPLGLDAKELARFLAQEAQIALSPGHWFGREGAGFGRMAIACPRSTLSKAMENLATAIKGLS